MKVQNKFLLTFGALFVVFSAVLGYSFQMLANREIKKEFINRGALLAANFAHNARLSIVFKDDENLSELMNGLIEQPDVVYAAIYDAQGNLILEAGESTGANLSGIPVTGEDTTHIESLLDREFVEFRTPVYLNDKLEGYVRIALSLQGLRQTLKSANIKSLTLFLAFNVVGFLIINLVVRHMLRDLIRIRKFAAEFAEGHHGRHITLKRKDEIGDLAESLNILSDRIQESLTRSEENFRQARQNAEIIEEHHKQAIEEKKKLEQAVSEIVHTLAKIKDGDLTSPVVSEMSGEIARVAAGLNLMIAEFSTVVQGLRTVSQAVSEVSLRISEIGNSIVSRSEHQFQNIDNIAAAIEEMAATLESANKSMEQASEIANRAYQAALDGGAIVQQAIEGINRIARVVDNSAKTVQSLGVQSQQINDIIQVIDEIADQTNLLALNAAIEAARAGEQGRGFAVVADEVRKLAERTSSATGEIAEVIKKILSLTMKAVKAMENGNQEMKTGKELVQKVGSALEQIVNSVDAMQLEFERIVETSREQAVAANQISDQIGRVRNIAKENADSATEVQETGAQLEAQTRDLSALINRFKVGDEAFIRSLSQKALVELENTQTPEPNASSQPVDPIMSADGPPRPEPPYTGPERRKTDQPGLYPEGRRASDRGNLGVTPDGDIEPLG